LKTEDWRKKGVKKESSRKQQEEGPLEKAKKGK
jgi:hypothetical protein